MSKFNLLEADRIEVTVLVDNYTELHLQSTDIVRRPDIPTSVSPLAEHGLSCLIRVYAGHEEQVVLMDAGFTPVCLFHNIEIFKIDVDEIECVVLSHGHRDHFGGLIEFFNHTKKKIPLILHPDAFLQRRSNKPNAEIVDFPSLNEEALMQTGGVIVHKIKEPSTACSDLILVLGEVERVTGFEKGIPFAEVKIGGKWAPDHILDDQGVAVSVKNKGLVVISGCAHAGIINTVKHAQKVSGIDKVHAVLGGFHLCGPEFEPIIARTTDELKKVSPNFIVPMHCTGWKAMNNFAQEMPEQFLLNTVGTTYVFQ